MEKHLFQLRIEVTTPAQVEEVEQRQQQLFAQGNGRVQGHGLVELLVKGALGQVGNGLDQLELSGLPVTFGRCAGGFVQQLAYLADRCSTLQPAKDCLDPFHLIQRIQAMPLGGALRLE